MKLIVVFIVTNNFLLTLLFFFFFLIMLCLFIYMIKQHDETIQINNYNIHIQVCMYVFTKQYFLFLTHCTIVKYTLFEMTKN